MVKNNSDVYKILEKLLVEAGDNPQTCADLIAHKEVRDLVPDVKRLSDHLGHMWRKNVIKRWYSNDISSKARYAYTWISSKQTGTRRVVIEKKEDVVIDLPDFTITIKHK